MKILDGRKIAEKILREIRQEIKAKKKQLILAIVQVGGDAVNESYLKQKQLASEEAGVNFLLFRFSAGVKEEVLAKKITALAKSRKVSGIVIQLPLPKKINSQKILNLIPLKKDPDCLSDAAFGRFAVGESVVLPPVAGAVKRFLNECQVEVKGKNVVLIGSGRLVGRPLANWFLNQKASLSVLNSSTKDISLFVKKADIIVSGVGQPGLIIGRMVKKEAMVIDAGASSENGRIEGDVDFNSVSKKAGYLTPPVGGVGPLAVACLLENLFILNR